MPDLDSNRVTADTASGGGRVIVGLVVAAVMFLALLLLFGERLFSGGIPGGEGVEQAKVETSTK